MAWGSVTLVPGVNTQRTPTLLRAGISQSSLIRFKDSLAQKFGGWAKFYPFAVSGVPRDMHAWQDLNEIDHLAIGTTTSLNVITDGDAKTITPQTLVSDCPPRISTTSASRVVGVFDPNISNLTVYDSVFFNVPISQGGLILDGLYPIASITGTNSYTILAETEANATTTNPTATNNTTAAGNPTLHFATTPTWVAAGAVVANATVPATIPTGTMVNSVTATTAVMSANAAAPGVANGDNITFGFIPIFTTTSSNSVVSVQFQAHGLSAGDLFAFNASTTGNGVTIFGLYPVLSVTDANNFTIQASSVASASGAFPMNGGEAQFNYYITLGPLPAGQGYGLGNYGAGAYGFGSAGGSAQTGAPITAEDWTSDNWGQILLACPKDGPIYYYDPTGGFLNASLISTGPPFNTGIFVSMSQQILVAYGSSVAQAVGVDQQPMLVQWCDVGNFLEWRATSSTQAGNFTIPIGSELVGGMAVANQNLLWTDLDLWAMNYIGPPDVFGFNKIGAGMGLVSGHAAQQLRGSVYWMGRTNFYGYTGGGANVIPCPVWDAVFQNLNTDFLRNIRAMPNTPFNEAGWLYPSAASANGECDSYVKMNITEPGAPWDYGPIPRSAWIDQTVLGMPIGADPQGFIYQHETTNDADGQPLASSFTTGYFYLAEGEDFAIVDQVIPDFKWGTFAGSPSAEVQLTFNVVDWPGDTPRTYGPYTVTSTTKYITTRFRGRLMSITVESQNLGGFYRLGSCKYRFAASGRR